MAKKNPLKNSLEYIALKPQLMCLPYEDFLSFIRDWMEENDSDMWDASALISIIASWQTNSGFEALGIIEKGKLEYIKFWEEVQSDNDRDENLRQNLSFN